MSDVPPEAIEAMVALVTKMACGMSVNTRDHYAEASRIYPMLPKPVDQVMLAAREVVACLEEEGNYPEAAKRTRQGLEDDSWYVRIAFAAVRAGLAVTPV